MQRQLALLIWWDLKNQCQNQQLAVSSMGPRANPLNPTPKPIKLSNSLHPFASLDHFILAHLAAWISYHIYSCLHSALRLRQYQQNQRHKVPTANWRSCSKWGYTAVAGIVAARTKIGIFPSIFYKLYIYLFVRLFCSFECLIILDIN